MTNAALNSALEQGFAALGAGDPGRARALSEQIIAVDPTNPHGHHLAGLAEHQRGDAQAAAQHLEQAVQGDPDQPEFHLNYGVSLEHLGRLDDAAGQYRAALSLALSLSPGTPPFAARAAANLGFVLRRKGDHLDALKAFERALALDAGHVGAQLGFVHILGGLRAPDHSPDLEAALVRGLDLSHANHADLAAACAHQLSLKHGFAAAPQANAPEAITPETISQDPLFSAYLERCLNADPALELFLTGLRRSLILMPPPEVFDDALRTAALLAGQCFQNEYVFLAEEDEMAAVADLKRHLESILIKDPDADPDPEVVSREAVLYALYAPLNTLECRDILANMPPGALGADLDRLIELTLRDPLAEQDIRDGLETLNPITDETSLAVGAMYEENPYPRWLHAPAQQPVALAANLDRLFPHFTPPHYGESPDILIAGCGTGQHIVHAARTNPGASITAIDLSKASLAYAVRMVRKLDIANVRFLQADILNLENLGQTFDMIQSVGVLHHMKDPLAGWRVLEGLLRPGGVFKAGLYSARGRMSIEACRRLIAAEGIASTPADIARFRRRIMSAEPDGKDGNLAEVMETRDFFTTSMCRDLLFHVQEHNTSPLALKADLAATGLEFIGFEGFEEAGINAAYREAYPGDPAQVDLDNWGAFEVAHGPLTDMYVFWCHKPPA